MLTKSTLLAAHIVCISVHVAFTQTPVKRFQSVTALHALENKIILSASDGISGEELWVSDGTPEGTRLLKDIYPGYGSASPERMTSFNGKIYFNAYSPQFESELWSTDGTPEGTSMFVDLTPQGDYYGGTSAVNLTVFKDHLYFISSKDKLYKTDGQADNLSVVDAAHRGLTGQLSIAAGKLYYYKGSDILYWTDGSSGGELDLPLDIEDTYFKGLYATETQLYAIRSSSYDTHIKLYALNHTTNIWAKVFELKAPVYGDQEISNVTAMGDKLFFSIRKDYENEPGSEELWLTNGTLAGTKMLKSFNWKVYSSGSGMENFKVFNNILYFRSGDASDRSLWKSDGTPEGTMMVHDVVMQRPMQLPNAPVIADDRLYFAGSSEMYSTVSLWSTDGTTAGTRKEMDLQSNLGGLPYLLTSTGSLVYFITGDQFASTLWNNSPAPEINVTAPYGANILVGGTQYFPNTPEHGCALETLVIKNDGTKTLALGSVKIIGNDFALEGSLPEMLNPGESATISLVFHPLSKGSKRGSLTISSGDDNEGSFVITLNGVAPTDKPPGFCDAFNNNFTRYLHASQTSKTIALSGTAVPQLVPAGTLVGAFSISGSSDVVAWSLVPGNGDTHNNFFTIESAELKTNKVFFYGEKNFYSIRVRATLQDESVREESFALEVGRSLLPPMEATCAPTSEVWSYGLTDVAVNSEGKLFIITTMGQIHRSDDEGATWSVTDIGYPGRLQKIFFKGNVGYITGQYFMLKSDDNGKTWFNLYVPPSAEVVSAYFLDENTGYVSSSGGSILFTDDGGRTWTVRREGYSFGDGMGSLCFLDRDKGFATDSHRDLLKTVDGGKTWTEIDLGSLGYIDLIRQILFLNHKEGFIVANNKLLHTSDGGTTWEGMSLASSELQSIKFLDDKRGYVAASGNLYNTIDGGKNWTWTTGPPGFLSGFAIHNDKIYTTHFGSYDYYGHSGRAMYMSPDNGQTWHQLQRIDNGDHFAISFPSALKGFVFSEYSNYQTSDGGLTWKVMSWNNRISSAHFFDENTAIFSDNEKLYRSTDGGETITEVLTPESDPMTDRRPGPVYAATDNLVFSYSWYGLYRSTDAGANWTSIAISEQPYTEDMHFPSEETGYMVELFGSVYKTTDAGLTWARIFNRDPDEVNVTHSIFFVNDNIGYRGGARFSKTTDGGETWQEIFTGLQAKIWHLHFTSELQGYAITEQGRLYETADGGKSWEELYIRDAEVVYDVEFRNGDIYLAGEDGYIAHYKGQPTPPLPPGYISGPRTVCVGDVQIFNLAPLYSGRYSWSAPGTTAKEGTSSLEIHFTQPGDYTLTVKSSNGCGVTDPRTFLVTAETLEVPVISGEEIVAAKAENEYEVQNFDESMLYGWDVSPEGTVKTGPSAQSIAVRWMTFGLEPIVSVIATDLESGCRIRGDEFRVSVTLPVGVDEQAEGISVYPNPADRELLISSNIRLDSAELYHVDGKLFLHQQIVPVENSGLDVSRLPRGLYILRLFQGRKVMATRKIIVR